VCWKDAYGRGVGKPVHSCKSNLEDSGALCYPHCRENYTGVGPVCWENCKTGYSDEGVFCWRSSQESYVKKSYGRGVGEPLRCNPMKEELDSYTGLCYPKCKANWEGVGPLCWRKCDCSAGHQCMVSAGALCCNTKKECRKEIFDLTIDLPIQIAKAATIDSSSPSRMIADIKQAVEDLLDLVLPMCSKLGSSSQSASS